MSDLATQHLHHALSAAWDTWRYSDEEHYLKEFAQRFAEEEFQEVVDVIGFDPRSLSREQWAEIQSLINFIWHDEETQALLMRFAEDYLDAQHALEKMEMAGEFAIQIAPGVLISALSLGAGATLGVGSKAARLSGKLGNLGKLFKQLAQSLKKRAGSRVENSRTGKWVELKLEKPENRTLENGSGREPASQGRDDATAKAGPNTTLRKPKQGGLSGTPELPHPNAKRIW